MCGRFNVTDMHGLQNVLDDLNVDLRLPEPRYNVAPTEDILLLRNGTGDYGAVVAGPVLGKRSQH